MFYLLTSKNMFFCEKVHVKGVKESCKHGMITSHNLGYKH